MNIQQSTVDPKILEEFDNFLGLYQDDLVKIIGKYRGKSHPLDSDELLSEVNLYLIKNKYKIIEYIDSTKGIANFDYNSFKHTAFVYCRNLIKWTYLTLTSKDNKAGKWYSQRIDKVYHTEDGEKTSLDIALETNGVESEVDDIKIGDKYKYILDEIKSKLTNAELNIFIGLQEGKMQKDIAEEAGVTRQAIDLTYQKIIKKVKSIGALKDGISSKVLNDDLYDKVSEGQNAIEDFFDHGEHVYFSDSNKNELLDILLKNPGKFTGEYISKNFFDGKFSEFQIINQARHLTSPSGLGIFLKRKKQKYKKAFTDEQELEIIKLTKKGLSSKEIANKFGVFINSINAKQTHFYKTGRILETSNMRAKRLRLLKRVFKSKLFDYRREKIDVTDDQKRKIIDFFNIGAEIVKLNSKDKSKKEIKQILLKKFKFKDSSVFINPDELNLVIDKFINYDFMPYLVNRLKIPHNVIHGYRCHFVSKGLITKFERPKVKSYKRYEYSYILKALRNGYKYKEIANHIDLDIKSVRSILIHSVRKKTITRKMYFDFFNNDE